MIQGQFRKNLSLIRVKNPLRRMKTIQDMEYDETVSEEYFNKIEYYDCINYRKAKLKSPNEARLDISVKQYKTKSKNEVINCVKKKNEW